MECFLKLSMHNFKYDKLFQVGIKTEKTGVSTVTDLDSRIKKF